MSHDLSELLIQLFPNHNDDDDVGSARVISFLHLTDLNSHLSPLGGAVVLHSRQDQKEPEEPNWLFLSCLLKKLLL